MANFTRVKVVVHSALRTLEGGVCEVRSSLVFNALGHQVELRADNLRGRGNKGVVAFALSADYVRLSEGNVIERISSKRAVVLIAIQRHTVSRVVLQKHQLILISAFLALGW